jgi:hypothetical protein
MVFLSGAPEIFLMTLVALVLLTVIPGLTDRGPSLCRKLWALFVTCALFGLLSAVQILPFLELKSASIREGGLSYWEATLWSFGFRDFLQFFLNDAFGAFHNLDRYWENQAWLKSVYTGLIPFALSIFFFLSSDKRRLLFAVLMLLSLVLALGGSTPLYHLLYRLPPFDGLRYPVKFLFLFLFALSVTAGLGLDKIKAGGLARDRRTNLAMWIIFSAGLLFAVAWGCEGLFHGRVYSFLDARGYKPNTYNVLEVNLRNAARFLLFSSLACFSVALYFRMRRPIVLYAVIPLLLLDLFLANTGDFRTGAWKTYAAPPSFAEDVVRRSALDRYIVDEAAAAELYAFPHNRAVLAPTYAGVFGLYAASGSEVMKVAHQHAFLELIKKSPSIAAARNLLASAGIRYVITLEKIRNRRFRLVRSISAESVKRKEKVRVYLYEYTQCPDRVFLVGKTRFAGSDNDAAKAVGRMDPRGEVVLQGAAARLPGTGKVSGQARIVEYGPNRVEIEYSADRACFLYLGDTFYPGWRAYIDGSRTPVLRANLAFRALSVPKGAHRVLFEYFPLSFYYGLALTLAGIGLSIFLIGRGGRKEITPPRPGDVL